MLEFLFSQSVTVYGVSGQSVRLSELANTQTVGDSHENKKHLSKDEEGDQ